MSAVENVADKARNNVATHGGRWRSSGYTSFHLLYIGQVSSRAGRLIKAPQVTNGGVHFKDPRPY